MSSLDYPLTTMARAALFASNGLSLTHNSPGRGTSLLLMIPLIKGHEECVDGALPLAKSCWMGDHLSAARRCCSSSRAAPLVLVVCPPPPVLLTLDPHSTQFTPTVHHGWSPKVGDVDRLCDLPLQAVVVDPCHPHCIPHISPPMVVV